MPTITDWLMVIITAIYVAATVAIWCANRKSASATEKQLIESRRQFAENQRLQLLPSLQVDVDEISYTSKYRAELEFTLFADEQLKNCRKTCFALSLENAGLGTAKNLMFSWIGAEGNADSGVFPVAVLYQQDAVKYMISVGIMGEHAKEGETLTAQLIIQFKDLLDNQYQQTILLTFVVRADMYAVLQESKIEKLSLME